MTKILIIDNHQLTLDVITDILLEEKKYDIYAFAHLPSIAFLQKMNPQIIILEASLQGKNSLYICQELKQALQESQIIITSAYIDNSSLVYQSGADGFLKKPFDIDDLLESVDICCKKN